MKLRLLLISFIIVLFGYNAHSQVTVDNTLTVQQLVEEYFLGEGIFVSNITFNGLPADSAFIQIGLYEGNGSSNVIDFESGLAMVTADAAAQITGEGLVANPVDTDNSGNGYGNDDSDLVTIANPSGTSFNVNDAAILEFDFVVVGDSITFKYVFASDEYPSFTCSNYNDAFGFFLSGPDISGPFENGAINLALIPGSDTPVAINTLNSGVSSSPGNESNCAAANPNWVEDSQYFVSNSGTPFGDVSFPGMTQTLTAAANVIPCETYHIKMAIGDVSDQGFNSGVFLEAGSFELEGDIEVNLSPTIDGAPVTTPGFENVLIPGCSTIDISITKPSCLPADTAFIVYGGTAIQGEDYEFLNQEDSITFFPPNINAITIQFDILWDGVPDENEVLEIYVIWVNLFGELDTVTASIPFIDPYSISSETEDVVVTCPADQVQIAAQGLDGIEPYYYDWIDNLAGEDLTEVMVDVPPDSVYYLVGISDQCAFEVIYDSVLVTNNIPPPLQATIDGFTQPECTNEPVGLHTSIQDGNGEYTIVWTDGNDNGYFPNENITVQNINSTIVFNPDPIGYTEVLPVYLMVIDTCGTIVTDTIQINYPFFEPLTANFTPLTDNCPEEPVVITSQPEFGAGDYFYAWEKTNGEFGVGADLNASFIHVVPAGGMNNYTLTVTDFCAREGYSYNYVEGDSGDLFSGGLAVYEDSLRVIKLDKIMNIITPNGDNRNDFFAIEGVEEFEDARLEVYDRWGKLIFETDNYMAGKPQIKTDNAFDADGFGDGTYFYIINVESGECVTSGTIEVLRGSN
ncbi:gliding motility-associated C-terminal domain-containing protein [Cryomorpha ignava]|uniref:Gliding motility-associated C-terminal domain-containing protein n=1 Tax=Cryomorpha ignava TaxID=101383 RepID=A0A7K3WSC6_9FLAO|nr:choice-of-anchor L domain-containing protein [Cryomorpha ignava]NEN23971.1 gliding motility-associated C-terminal domain-containing protein [Cryomorpha ignava]